MKGCRRPGTSASCAAELAKKEAARARRSRRELDDRRHRDPLTRLYLHGPSAAPPPASSRAPPRAGRAVDPRARRHRRLPGAQPAPRRRGRRRRAGRRRAAPAPPDAGQRRPGPHRRRRAGRPHARHRPGRRPGLLRAPASPSSRPASCPAPASSPSPPAWPAPQPGGTIDELLVSAGRRAATAPARWAAPAPPCAARGRRARTPTRRTRPSSRRWPSALNERDRYTGEHSTSVVEMARTVAVTLGLDDLEVERVAMAAVLHDIGKVAIPDRILHKPSRAGPEEWDLMREHPVIGERILRAIPGMGAVARIVRHEHEHFDGGRLPGRAARRARSRSARRIILACDTYSAMTTSRPYRAAMSHGAALAELAPLRRDAVRPAGDRGARRLPVLAGAGAGAADDVAAGDGAPRRYDRGCGRAGRLAGGRAARRPGGRRRPRGPGRAARRAASAAAIDARGAATRPRPRGACCLPPGRARGGRRGRAHDARASPSDRPADRAARCACDAPTASRSPTPTPRPSPTTDARGWPGSRPCSRSWGHPRAVSRSTSRASWAAGCRRRRRHARARPGAGPLARRLRARARPSATPALVESSCPARPDGREMLRLHLQNMVRTEVISAAERQPRARCAARARSTSPSPTSSASRAWARRSRPTSSAASPTACAVMAGELARAARAAREDDRGRGDARLPRGGAARRTRRSASWRPPTPRGSASPSCASASPAAPRCREPATGTGGPVNIASRVDAASPAPTVRAGHPRGPRRRPRELPLVGGRRADDQGRARPGAPLPRAAAGVRAGRRAGPGRGRRGGDDRRRRGRAPPRAPSAAPGAAGRRRLGDERLVRRGLERRPSSTTGSGRRSVRTDGAASHSSAESTPSALSTTRAACSPSASASGPTAPARAA